MEHQLHDRDRVGVQDAVLLEDFNNQDVFVDNLQKRFKEHVIYVSTYIPKKTTIYVIKITYIQS